MSLLICIGASATSENDQRQQRFTQTDGRDFKNARLDQSAFGAPSLFLQAPANAQDEIYKSPKPPKRHRSQPPRPIEPALVGAELANSDFQNASLIQASLIQANLREANFANADLTQASLHGADLSKANFTGASLNQTHLEDANLADAVGLTQKQLDLAIVNDRTKLPAGLRRPGRAAGG